MKILVTGSAGHLGEAVLRTLRSSPHEAMGIDIRASPYTDRVGSITQRSFVHECVTQVDAILHIATLHKPHVATHARQEFVDTNITGTLNLLEEAVSAGVKRFVFTSTTSVFGHALTPADGAPAVWITEQVTPKPKNIYGITKLAAEQLCESSHRENGLPCLVLRTSRFFPEQDDDPSARQIYADDNLKINEFLYRRVDIEDAVSAHLIALHKAPQIGFDRFIVSATTPFVPDDLRELRVDAARVVNRYFPEFANEYARRGWSMAPTIDRVYVNDRARARLDWQPRFDFGSILRQLARCEDYRSQLSRAVGSKGYHPADASGG